MVTGSQTVGLLEGIMVSYYDPTYYIYLYLLFNPENDMERLDTPGHPRSSQVSKLHHHRDVELILKLIPHLRPGPSGPKAYHEWLSMGVFVLFFFGEVAGVDQQQCCSTKYRSDVHQCSPTIIIFRSEPS